MPNPFAHHTPNEDEVGRIERIREECWRLCGVIDQYTEPRNNPAISGRYVSLAKSALEEVCQWAVKSIVFERDNT